MEKIPPEWCEIVMANSDKKGATVQFPFPGCVPSSTMLKIHADAPHPKIGSGAMLVLRIPAIPGVKQDVELANRLNLLEMQQWSRTRSFAFSLMKTYASPLHDWLGTFANRSTAVVVSELFREAEHSVLVAGYAVYQGQRVFQALGDRMVQIPSLKFECSWMCRGNRVIRQQQML